MSAADERTRAMTTVYVDFARALQMAEQVGEGRHRCQSLAAVARFTPTAYVARVAD